LNQQQEQQQRRFNYLKQAYSQFDKIIVETIIEHMSDLTEIAIALTPQHPQYKTIIATREKLSDGIKKCIQDNIALLKELDTLDELPPTTTATNITSSF